MRATKLTILKDGIIEFSKFIPPSESTGASFEKIYNDKSILLFLENGIEIGGHFTLQDFCKMVENYPDLLKISEDLASLIEEIKKVKKLKKSIVTEIFLSKNIEVNYCDMEKYPDAAVFDTVVFNECFIVGTDANYENDYDLRNFKFSEIVGIPIRLGECDIKSVELNDNTVDYYAEDLITHYNLFDFVMAVTNCLMVLE